MKLMRIYNELINEIVLILKYNKNEWNISQLDVTN